MKKVKAFERVKMVYSPGPLARFQLNELQLSLTRA